MPHWEILIFFFIVSMVYASVGFGGGSSYLAILALYNFHYEGIRIVALLCNIVVVTNAVVFFIIQKQVNWKKILPLVIMSIPMAFLGGYIKLGEKLFFIILGLTLIVASILLWITNKQVSQTRVVHHKSLIKNTVLGGTIGFLSGMVGIGGGIFLSPLLNLMNWDTAKNIAVAASIFILVNSLSGIFGQLLTFGTSLPYVSVLSLLIAVLAGGQIGSRLLLNIFDPVKIRRITAVLVFVAGVEVLIKHF